LDPRDGKNRNDARRRRRFRTSKPACRPPAPSPCFVSLAQPDQDALTQLRKKRGEPESSPLRNAETVPVRSLFRCCRLCRGVRVLLCEPLDAPCRIDQLLLAREKRVAVRANFDAQRVALDGRPR